MKSRKFMSKKMIMSSLNALGSGLHYEKHKAFTKYMCVNENFAGISFVCLLLARVTMQQETSLM